MLINQLNNFMKKLFILLFVVLASLQSCKQKDACADVICPVGQVCVDGTCQGSSTNILITTNISVNTTWTANNVYELGGRITVLPGVSLTIEPGTIIKGQVGTGANATALLVARGAKIVAIGTATLPIIFTSIADEITPEQVGGVGNGTTIENIEIIGNQDDGVEFFGGNVNVSNLVVWNSGDDAIDTDQAWAGTLDNFIVICGNATDHALEIDGPEGTFMASHTIRNGSIKGSSEAELGDFRACPRGRFENIFFFDFPDPAINGRGDLSITNPSSSTCSTNNLTSGVLTFSNLQVILPTNVVLNSVFKNGTDVFATSVNNIVNRTVGANKSIFNWTWTEQANQLITF